MRRAAGVVMALGVTLALAGCDEADLAAAASKVAAGYCALAPQSRERVRDQVAARIAPHRLELVCAGELPAGGR